MKKQIMIAAALSLFSVGAYAQGADIGGRYDAQGTNIDGSPYKGTAEIVVTTTTTCRITWRTGSSSVQQGICMRNGNTLSAAYTFANGKPGLIIYEMQRDGSMKGLWTIADQKGVGTENLTPR